MQAAFPDHLDSVVVVVVVVYLSLVFYVFVPLLSAHVVFVSPCISFILNDWVEYIILSLNSWGENSEMAWWNKMNFGRQLKQINCGDQNTNSQMQFNLKVSWDWRNIFFLICSALLWLTQVYKLKCICELLIYIFLSIKDN